MINNFVIVLGKFLVNIKLIIWVCLSLQCYDLVCAHIFVIFFVVHPRRLVIQPASEAIFDEQR